MKLKVFVAVVAVFLVVSLAAGFIFADYTPETTQQSGPVQTILIRPDGSISPSDVPIERNGDTYTLQADVYGTLKIQKSNIILDGAGYTLHGPYNGNQTDVWVVGNGPDQNPASIAEWVIGVDFSAESVQGVTLENLNVHNFSIGMYIWTKNNTVNHCSAVENIVGILLSGINNTVTYDYIENNKQGLFMGFNNEGNTEIPADIVIHHNDFENNEVQLNGCNCLALNTTEAPHTWDDGREGNFWSNYNGTDADGDGRGDSAYVVDALNFDRYPLMASPVVLPAPQTNEAANYSNLLYFAALFVIIAAAVLVTSKLIRRRR